MKKNNKIINIFKNFSIHTLLIIWCIFQIFPLIWLIYSSFKPTIEIYKSILAFPKTLYLENYYFANFIQENVYIGVYYRNSILVAIITLAITIFVTYIGGYAIGRFDFKGKNILVVFLIFLLGVPTYSVLVPIYRLAGNFGLLSKLIGVSIVHVAFLAPFVTLMLQTFFRQFPNELIEAAKVDGCNEIKAFTNIVLPLSFGQISSIFIVVFIWVWNEFVMSFIILKNNFSRTLPVGIAIFNGQYRVEYGHVFSSMVVTMLPVIIFYLIFHRRIIKGVLAGSVKG